MSKLKDDSIKASSWSFASLMINQIRNFIVSVILARLLFPEDFGLLGMAMVFAGIADSFVDFGFGNSIIQKQKVTKLQMSTVFWINMTFGVLLGICMFLVSDLVAFYFELPRLKDIVRVMSFTFIIKGLNVLQLALFKKELNFRTPFIVTMLSGTISGIVGIVLAFMGFGVWSLVWSQISGWLMGTTMIWVLSKWKPSFIFSINSVKELWQFGYKYSLSIFIDVLFSKFDTIVIGKLFSAATLGLFYKAQALNRLVVQYAFSSFSTVLFPSFSKLNHDTERLITTVKKVLHFTCFTTFLFAGLTVINAKEIIIILYTEKWMGSIKIFEIIGLFSYIVTIPPILTSPVLSVGKSGPVLRIEIIKKTLYLIAIPVGIYYGLYGYLIGTIIAANVGIVLNMRLLSRVFSYKITAQLKLISGYIGTFFTLMGLYYLTSSMFPENLYLSLCVKTFLYILFYVIAAWKLGLIGYFLTKKIFKEKVIHKLPYFNNFEKNL